jgi:ribonuclease BN (tRNA processing enzyme)
MSDVDILIADCSYTKDEYFEAKIGWGHGTFDHSIEMATRVGAKKLICTHHEPTRTDKELKQVFDEAVARFPSSERDLEIILAYEGLELEL